MIIDWSGVYAQERAKNALSKIFLSGKIPHAFLFSGPAGTGKYFTAIRFAQLLNSTAGEETYLNSLASVKIEKLAEPHIKYILPLPRGKNETGNDGPLDRLSKDDIDEIRTQLDKKITNPYFRVSIPNANTIKISSIREIRKFIALNFDDIKYKVIIISDAHLMNDEGQNALLKSLEEPPAGIIFILLTSEGHNLLETIRSRCWNVKFDPLDDNSISDILINNFNMDEKTAFAAAPFAGGSVDAAINLIEHDFEHVLEKAVMVLRYSLGQKFHSALKEINEFLDDSSGEYLQLLIQLIIFWLDDTLKNKINYSNYYFKKYIDTLEKFNKGFPHAQVAQTIQRLDILASSVGSNVNLNVIGLNIIFEIANLKQTG